MEIFGRPGRTTREVTLGRVIRESLSAEGLFQQKGERAPAVGKARNLGQGKALWRDGAQCVLRPQAKGGDLGQSGPGEKRET